LIFRTLKDTRRRISQTVLSKVGSADETKDVQYDAHVEHFHSMISDMNQCKIRQYTIQTYSISYTEPTIFIYGTIHVHHRHRASYDLCR